LGTLGFASIVYVPVETGPHERCSRDRIDLATLIVRTHHLIGV
jgi:hypothetical protein